MCNPNVQCILLEHTGILLNRRLEIVTVNGEWVSPSLSPSLPLSLSLPLSQSVRWSQCWVVFSRALYLVCFLNSDVDHKINNNANNDDDDDDVSLIMLFLPHGWHSENHQLYRLTGGSSFSAMENLESAGYYHYYRRSICITHQQHWGEHGRITLSLSLLQILQHGKIL